MVWQKIDDQFGVSKKVSRLPRSKRLRCVGLWLLALNASARYGTNGVLELDDLSDLDARDADLAELVRVGMWHRTGHACARCVQPPAAGIVIHDFLEYNPDAESVAAVRASKSEGGRHGNHVRWHEARGIVVASCEWCASHDRSGSDRIGVAGASDGNPPGPVPGPVPQTDVTHPGPVTPEATARDGLTDEEMFAEDVAALGIRNFERVRSLLEGALGFGIVNPGAVLDLARAVLHLAKGSVRSPDAYISKTCTNSPHEVQAEWVSLQRRLGAVAA
jgi:hypothetical protein